MKCEFCGKSIPTQMDLSMDKSAYESECCVRCYRKYVKGFIVYFDGKYLYRSPSKQSKMVKTSSVKEVVMANLNCKEREQISIISGKISVITELQTTIVGMKQNLENTLNETKEEIFKCKVIRYGEST